MIMVSGETKDGRPLLLLGLSRKNCEQVLADKPISQDTGVMGGSMPDVRVMIFAGETEDEMYEMLQGCLTIGKVTGHPAR